MFIYRNHVLKDKNKIYATRVIDLMTRLDKMALIQIDKKKDYIDESNLKRKVIRITKKNMIEIKKIDKQSHLQSAAIQQD
jgi:hypothetical protein